MLQKSLLLANPDSEHVAASATVSHKQHKEQQTDELSEMHSSLRTYCNDVITKWQDHTQIASGRVSGNKDFVKSNQSIVTQINHVSIMPILYILLTGFSQRLN